MKRRHEVAKLLLGAADRLKLDCSYLSSNAFAFAVAVTVTVAVPVAISFHFISFRFLRSLWFCRAFVE